MTEERCQTLRGVFVEGEPVYDGAGILDENLELTQRYGGEAPNRDED